MFKRLGKYKDQTLFSIMSFSIVFLYWGVSFLIHNDNSLSTHILYRYNDLNEILSVISNSYFNFFPTFVDLQPGEEVLGVPYHSLVKLFLFSIPFSISSEPYFLIFSIILYDFLFAYLFFYFTYKSLDVFLNFKLLSVLFSYVFACLIVSSDVFFPQSYISKIYHLSEFGSFLPMAIISYFIYYCMNIIKNGNLSINLKNIILYAFIMSIFASFEVEFLCFALSFMLITVACIFKDTHFSKSKKIFYSMIILVIFILFPAVYFLQILSWESDQLLRIGFSEHFDKLSSITELLYDLADVIIITFLVFLTLLNIRTNLKKNFFLLLYAFYIYIIVSVVFYLALDFPLERSVDFLKSYYLFLLFIYIVFLIKSSIQKKYFTFSKYYKSDSHLVVTGICILFFITALSGQWSAIKSQTFANPDYYASVKPDEYKKDLSEVMSFIEAQAIVEDEVLATNDHQILTWWAGILRGNVLVPNACVSVLEEKAIRYRIYQFAMLFDWSFQELLNWVLIPRNSLWFLACEKYRAHKYYRVAGENDYTAQQSIAMKLTSWSDAWRMILPQPLLRTIREDYRSARRDSVYHPDWIVLLKEDFFARSLKRPGGYEKIYETSNIEVWKKS